MAFRSIPSFRVPTSIWAAHNQCRPILHNKKTREHLPVVVVMKFNRFQLGPLPCTTPTQTRRKTGVSKVDLWLHRHPAGCGMRTGYTCNHMENSLACIIAIKITAWCYLRSNFIVLNGGRRVAPILVGQFLQPLFWVRTTYDQSMIPFSLITVSIPLIKWQSRSRWVAEPGSDPIIQSNLTANKVECSSVNHTVWKLSYFTFIVIVFVEVADDQAVNLFS